MIYRTSANGQTDRCLMQLDTAPTEVRVRALVSRQKPELGAIEASIGHAPSKSSFASHSRPSRDLGARPRPGASSAGRVSTSGLSVEESEEVGRRVDGKLVGKTKEVAVAGNDHRAGGRGRS